MRDDPIMVKSCFLAAMIVTGRFESFLRKLPNKGMLATMVSSQDSELLELLLGEQFERVAVITELKKGGDTSFVLERRLGGSDQWKPENRIKGYFET